MPREERGLASVSSPPMPSVHASPSERRWSRAFDGNSLSRNQSQVYVQHRDGGRARDAALDLPPSYSDPGSLDSSLEQIPFTPGAKTG